MEAFSTREKAETYKKKKGAQPVGFCPLLNGMCHVGCVCYVGSYISESKPGDYPHPAFYVHRPYCNNAMFYSND